LGIDDVVDGFASGLDPDAEARLLTATCGGVRVVTVYVPNGRGLDHPMYQHKLAWLARLRRHLEVSARADEDVVVCGDFNVAPDDRDVWDADACHGGTHVSPSERGALADVAGWGLTDVFRQRHQEDQLFSWWDYRAGNFHKHMGMRIDLLYASLPLAERLSWVLIDRNARKGKLPSDHAPLVAQFDDRRTS
jgi:exodeoxyribonuclease-3